MFWLFFVLVLVLVLSIAVLVLEATQYSYPAYWSASSREPLRSTIGIAAVQTAIEYEYRFTKYRFAEYEYDKIRCRARTLCSVAASYASAGQGRRQAYTAAIELFLASVGFMPNGVEFKAERRKPSGEKHCYIGDIPSLNGVLALFRSH